MVMLLTGWELEIFDKPCTEDGENPREGNAGEIECGHEALLKRRAGRRHVGVKGDTSRVDYLLGSSCRDRYSWLTDIYQRFGYTCSHRIYYKCLKPRPVWFEE